jgi:hypothetical protein
VPDKLSIEDGIEAASGTARRARALGRSNYELRRHQVAAAHKSEGV